MSISRRSRIVGTTVLALVVGTGGTAYAAGTYTAQAKQVVFFYDISSGNGDSNDFSGFGSAALCADAPGATSVNTYGASFIQNLTARPDQVRLSFDSSYRSPQVIKGNTSTSSSNRFHTNAGWSYAGNQAGAPNGFSRAVRAATCTSP